MTVEVRIQIADINLQDTETRSKIAARLQDYGWATISGITTMTVYSDGDPVADAVRAVRCAKHAGFNVLRVYEDRVNVNEIARRVDGPSREAIRKWTQLDTFPVARTVPNGSSDRGAQWDWADVLVWLDQYKAIDMDEERPTEAQVTQINAEIQGVTDFGSAALHHDHGRATFFFESRNQSLFVDSVDWQRDPHARGGVLVSVGRLRA